MTSPALTIFYAAEPLLMVLAVAALLKSKEQRRFPALLGYMCLRLSATVLLNFLLQLRHLAGVNGSTVYAYYFWTYWVAYLAGAVVVFLVVQELFQSAMAPFPGLKWLGTLSFRWVACISFVYTIAALFTPAERGTKVMLAMVAQGMRCESIFILSLLLFIMLAECKFGRSYRSRTFGISLGFGIMAVTDLVLSSTFFPQKYSFVTSLTSLINTGGSLLTLAVWFAYFMQPEPARRPTALNPSSPLARWNELAMTLGQTAVRPPVAVPAGDFFLQDVEKVVERMLVKNSLHVAS